MSQSQNNIQNLQTRHIINQITKDLESQLENIVDYDFNEIKSQTTKVLDYYENLKVIGEHKVICDNRNNPPNNNYLNVDVYLKPTYSGMINVNIAIVPDENKIRIKKLREERKNKLNKIYEG